MKIIAEATRIQGINTNIHSFIDSYQILLHMSWLTLVHKVLLTIMSWSNKKIHSPIVKLRVRSCFERNLKDHSAGYFIHPVSYNY